MELVSRWTISKSNISTLPWFEQCWQAASAHKWLIAHGLLQCHRRRALWGLWYLPPPRGRDISWFWNCRTLHGEVCCFSDAIWGIDHRREISSNRHVVPRHAFTQIWRCDVCIQAQQTQHTRYSSLQSVLTHSCTQRQTRREGRRARARARASERATLLL